MSVRALILCVFAGLAAAGCGSEIGDSCLVSTDCDPSGERTCIEQSRDGYCTILGCDYDTCPDEAVCVRFFAGEFANKTCDPVTEDDGTDDCSLDELCTISGHCVPRSAEQRFCMRKCDGDCRDGYECRDRALMEDHGGEPVLAPGERPDGDLQAFCAPAP